MTPHRIAALLVGALIGAFYWWVLIHAWGMHLADNPLNKWLLEMDFHRQHLTLYKAILYSHDVMINVLLAVPFASMFVLSDRLNNWPCLCVAVLVANVATYHGTDWTGSSLIVAHWGFWIGLGMSLLALPAAFLMVRAIPNRWLHEHNRSAVGYAQ
jgi:hypothetical protein